MNPMTRTLTSIGRPSRALLACWWVAVAALLGTAAPAARAVEESPPAQAASEAAPEEADFARPMGPEDPFNRGTPRGSMYGFITASREGDYERAARYLELRRLPASRRGEGPELARQLKQVLDRTLWVDFAELSDSQDGKAGDGLPAGRDRLGRIETSRGELDLLLQRVPRETDGVGIWKISSATVAQIPALYDEFGYGVLEQWLPQAFFEVQVLEVQLWQWVGVLVLVFAAWLFSWLLSSLVIRLTQPLFSRTETKLDDRIANLVQGPVRLALAVVAFWAGSAPLGLTLGARAWIGGTARGLLIVAFTWLLLRLVDLGGLVARERLLRTRQPGAVAFLLPGQRSVKVLIAALAGIAVLDNLGFNVAALLAGLGVGGIAVALAAQKTVENLFGGVTLLTDQPVRVGDFCRFGDKIGTVEEIGLRSTRVRSLDRTVITVPNAEFSAMQLENFAKRDQIRLFTMLGLRYETTPDQLRYVLARLREMLLAHPKITPDPARVRFVGFGAYSLDLEVFAYAHTSDWNEFMQIREDVYLRMMDIVDESGTGFAFPSQTTYLGKDDGLDEKRGRAAADQVQAWRAEGALPFPEFAEEHRGAIQDTLDYPPAGSPGASHRGNGARAG